MKNLWRAQTSFGLDTTSIILKKINLFEEVSEVTIKKIVYELMTIKNYDNHAMVYNDCSFVSNFIKHSEDSQQAMLQSLSSIGGQIARSYLR